MKGNIFTLLILLSVTASFGQSSLYLKRPYDASVFSDDAAEVAFSWNHDGSVNYTLEVANEPTFSSPVSFSTSNNQYTVAQSNLFSNENYWRITGSNGTSIVRSFEIIDLNSFGTISYHIDAQSNIVVSSGKVSEWGNKANGSYTATQGSNSLRPELLSSVINNNPVVKFGGLVGTNQHRLSLAPFELNQSNFSVFMTIKQRSINTGLPYVFGYQGNGLVGGIHMRGTAGTFNNFGIVYDPPLVQRRPNFMGDLKWATRSIVDNSIYFNNSEVAGYTGSGVDGLRFNTIGTRPDATQLNFHGDIAEVIIYNSNLPSVDRQIVDEYLITKYHPYPDLGNDMDTCTNQIVLGPIDDPAFNSVSWSTGATGVDSITVSQNGWYWVETEAFDRVVRDSIFIEGLVSKPELDQMNDTIICMFDTINISYANTLDPGISVLWSDGTSGSSVAVSQTDTIYATFTNLNGCTISSDTIVVSVNEFPATEGLGADRSICLNTNLFFEYGTSSGGPYSHLWGDGSTGPSFEPTTPGTQEYTIEVTDSMGCVAFDTVQIDLLNVEGPSAFFDVTNVCPFTPHTLLDASTPFTGDPIDTYSWYLPDDTLSGSIESYQFYDTVPYPVILEITSQTGCSNRYTDTARFYPQPDVYFVNSGNCEKNTISFLSNQLSSVPINTWLWNFDDPGSGANNQASGFNPTHNFNSWGSYDVELIGVDQNGCTDTISQAVEIDPSPQVEFSFVEVCDGNPVFFSNSSSINPINGNTINSFNWNFGDGSSSGQTEPQKIYNAAGTFQVILTATSNNGCSSLLQQEVKVHSFPQVDQVIDAECAGIEFSLSDNSFVNAGSIGNVSWSVSNGLELEGFSVMNVINESGSYDVIQTVSSGFGCTSADTFSLNLNDYLNADFDISPSAFIAGVSTNLTSTSIGADSYEWTIESIGSSYQPDTTVVFPSSVIGDTLEVQLVIENSFGCRDSVAVSLPVLERSTDLQVDELFLQESNGFYTVGVRLTNKGTTPINEVDLMLSSPSTPALKETWEGLLQASETTIYIFESSTSSAVPLKDTAKNYVCVEGAIIKPIAFSELDLSNNEACNLIEPSQSVVIAPQPNPVNELYTVKVILSASEKGSLKVFDAQGRVTDIIFEDIMLDSGLTTFEVDASQYANGSYNLRYVGETQSQSVRIIKQ